MGEECIRYHCRLAELLAVKKGEMYSTTISFVRITEGARRRLQG